MLTRLLQLSSPTLPVGAYSFSEGLERAVEDAWIGSEEDARNWIRGLLIHSVTRLDVPMFGHLYDAWNAGHHEDEAIVSQRSAWLLANRETAELRDSDRAMGRALARVLEGLDIQRASAWTHAPACTYAAMFALACAAWKITKYDGAQALAWTWVENQIAAAIKLVPLGQTSGQRVLHELGQLIPSLCAEALTLPEDQIGGAAMGLAMASANHEVQHTRLFRS